MMETATCERCGNAVPKVQLEQNFAGICPHCLGALLAREEKAPPPRSTAATLSRFDVEHAPFKPGEKFRSFEILDIVARGGMSYVFRARQTGLGRIVALKVLDPELAASETFRARFHREAKILATLNHPNIVQIYEFGQEGDLLYLAMEHVEGMDLETLLVREGRPERSRFLSIIRDAARGLRGIHDAGLVHRDIKPANLLITPEGRAKIADFGISIDSKENERLTETGTFIGTPHYVSPEHVQGRKVDGRSDLYSLGVILYQGLTGRTPFSAPNPTALLLKHVQEAPPAIWKLAEDLPSALGEMVRRLLAKNPSARPDSALALERELDRALGSSRPWQSMDDGPGTPAPASAPPRLQAPPSRAPEAVLIDRRVWIAALIGGPLLILGIIAWAFLGRSGGGETASSSPDRNTGASATKKMPEAAPRETSETSLRRDPSSTSADPDLLSSAPESTGGFPAAASVDAELLKLGASERRRRLEQLTASINLAGLTAAYADLRRMPETASHLRHLMARIEDKIKSLNFLMKRNGQEGLTGAFFLPTDRLSTFRGTSIEKMGPDVSIPLLHDFVTRITTGSSADVAVDRNGVGEEIQIQFIERPKELPGILQMVGLQAEDGSVPKPPTATPSPETRTSAPVTPPPAAAPSAAPRVPAPAATPSAGFATPVRKTPTPEGEVLKEADRLIHEVFKEDYAKKALVDRGYFAKKLLKHGLDAKDNGADTFVLLHEARDLAAQTGDLDTSLKAVREEARRFDVSEMESRMVALSTASKAARTPEEHAAIARALAQLADQATEENLDLCERVSTAGGIAARKGKEIPLVARFDAKLRECAEGKARAESIRRARETLSANLEDIAANQTLGTILCLQRGDWENGLANLSRGEPGRLKDIATQDLTRPRDSKAQEALADLWWELAEKEKGKSQSFQRRRAVYWYDRALGGLTGISQVKVRQKLATLGMGELGTRLLGRWLLDEGSGVLVRDCSGNDHPGAIEGGVWGKDAVAGSLGFDGDTSRVHLDLGEIPVPWTVTLWVRREASQRQAATLIDSRSQTGTSLRLEQSPSTHRVGITQYTAVDQVFDYEAPERTWVQLGFVALDKTVRLYANGSLAGTWERSVPLYMDKLGGQAILSFRGHLCDVRVYGRALDAGEIERLHDLGRR